MIRFVFSILFLFFLQIPAGFAQSSKAVESQYLAQLEPKVVSVWDESVILHASLLLKPTEAFNLPQLKVSVEIMLSTTGQVTNASVVASSGNDSFDHTALDAMLGLSRLPKPPTDLVSDDGLVHVFWTLARTAPFSPVKNASVRYVRFTPENAIARYLQSGLLAPAWKRLMETEQAGSVSRSSLEAFIQHFLLRFYPPLTLPADALTPLQSMLQWESLPASILIPYSKSLADDNAFAALLRRLSVRGPEVLCALFESTLEYSEKRSMTVLQALLERPEAGCPKVITDKGGASTWSSVKTLSMAMGLREAPSLADTDKQTWIGKANGSDLIPAIRVMGYSRKTEFFDFLLATYSKAADVEVISEIVHAIGFLPHSPAGLKLIGVLKHKQAKVRKAAIAGLVAYSGPDRDKHTKVGIWDLHKMVKGDADPEVKRLAAAAIITLVSRDLKVENNKHYFGLVLREKDPAVVEAMIDALSPEVDQAKKKLIAYLADPAVEIKIAAARRLVRLRQDPEIEAALRPWINNSDERLRYYALGYANVLAELTMGFDKLAFLPRTECAFQIARRDGSWLIKSLEQLAASGKPTDLFTGLPMLLGLLGNAH